VCWHGRKRKVVCLATLFLGPWEERKGQEAALCLLALRGACGVQWEQKKFKKGASVRVEPATCGTRFRTIRYGFSASQRATSILRLLLF
jgi:hypothetical protein